MVLVFWVHTCEGFSPKRGGDRKNGGDVGVQTLTKANVYEERLKPPASKLLPKDEYFERFTEEDMRAAGHYVANVQGRKMVVMPCARGTPWQLEVGMGKTLQNTDFAVDGRFSG